MPFAILFPGQGAQFQGMGADVFGRYPGLTEFACDLLGYDLVALCRDNPGDLLSRTDRTQPALYTVNALHTFERERREERRADCYLGHSLGEYNALLAAGAFDFETGLRLVKRRGELMAAASGGGMTAVMDAPEVLLLEIFEEDGIEGVDLAGFNTDSQIVIAAPDEVLRDAHAALGRRGIRFAPLRVSAPFHSRYMASARAEFEEFLRGFTFAEPHTTVIANVTGRPYERGAIAATLCEQIVAPVRWADSVRRLLDLESPLECEEVGGKSLLRMVDKIRVSTAAASPLR
ncbi:malonyl CoA-acyl carrier protein transacylase [Streptomyces olivoverticillatus]|uniref:Malonyl CoA-acyl carrier protein transacylase n=1 Tax=Streptomyces olivoverticillatus TaxID=66427 RepID=A0A7W7LNV1_9ACTN|nr:acyltransferase domain-containing protein [Streptomyces olivoverticillatus]MBB4893128.1 malonyl CoA-acyl carrier protein transacylase [Streptomyces olivoverticillatus]